MKIQNIESLSDSFIWSDSMGLITKSLGEAAGSKKIYVNIDTVSPNAFSTKYHSHSQQEEYFMILEEQANYVLIMIHILLKKGISSQNLLKKVLHTPFIILVMYHY